MQSENINDLAAALSAAQGELKHAPLNSTNPFLGNKYADLSSVIEAAKPILKKHGLSISQLPTSENGSVGVRTVLMHISGQYLSDTILLTLESQKGLSSAQAAGVIISYLRRYAYAAVLGMYSDQDNDGHTGNGHKNILVPGRTQSDLVAYAGKRGIEAKDVGKALKAAGINKFEVEQWDAMIKAIDDKAKTIKEGVEKRT